MKNILEINNFKSIKNLKETCTRINVFIGEPNTGKSNILEALGFLSFAQFCEGGNLHQFIRHTRITNLFYDDDIEHGISISCGLLKLVFDFNHNQFEGRAQQENNPITDFTANYTSIIRYGAPNLQFPQVKYYKFASQDMFTQPESAFLLPPVGNNLLSLLLTNRELRTLVNGIFSRYGLKLVLKPHENQIEIIKESEGILISYPYILMSDTLQRIIFHVSAVLSNKDSVLVFEEPESHSFPYYTKYLAELMALDKNNNQYFIATHNPYFLEPIIEKAPVEDVNVFITYFEDYQTKVKRLTAKQIRTLMQIDIFSNIDMFLKPNDNC